MYFFLRKVGYHVTNLTLWCQTMTVGVEWCDAQSCRTTQIVAEDMSIMALLCSSAKEFFYQNFT